MIKEKVYEILNECYFTENMHEKEIIQLLPKMLKRVKTFVDIGASLGQFTYFANSAMRNSEIIAIEADPIRFEELERNCKEWSQAGHGNRIRVIHSAVSDTNADINFNTTNSNISGGLFVHETSETGTSEQQVQWQSITVKSVTIDSLFLSPPDFIKMDIEGAELQALMGATKILEQGSTTWLIELHEWGSPKKVLDLMHSYGYRTYNFHGRKFFSRSMLKSNPSVWTIFVLHSIFYPLTRRVLRLLR